MSVVDDHATTLGEAVNALDVVRAPSLLGDVLGSSSDATGVAARIRESLRHPAWKAIEMIGAKFECSAHAAHLLEQVVRAVVCR